MAGKVTLRRPNRPAGLISLVPMIDVMMILLVFFMVTSTYLNLDMIPAVRQQDQASAPAPSSAAGPGETVMIRLAADGVPMVGGRATPASDLQGILQARLAADPLIQVIVLPSGAASIQALVSVMDAATGAGVFRLRIVRLEARP